MSVLFSLRRRAISFVAFGAFVGVGAGCTFLISFDDVPGADGGVNPTSTAPSIKDSGASSSKDTGDTTSGDTGVVVTGTAEVCDEAFQKGTIKGCENYKDNGQVCADYANNLTFPAAYDASADLITCSRAGTAHVSCIKHCKGAGKCAHNPDTYPDQCDQCTGKADGTYCGSEMAGWPPETFKLLITCGGGKIAKTTTACGVTCNPKGGTGQAACN